MDWQISANIMHEHFDKPWHQGAALLRSPHGPPRPTTGSYGHRRSAIALAENAARRLVLHAPGGCKILKIVSIYTYKNMTLTHQQLAELLAGIARSQQAIVDAIDRAQPGFRGTYLLPTLNVAANLRIPQTRLLDLPSRILLRSQGRVPMDAETIQRALQEALDGSVAFDPPPAPPPALSSTTATVSAISAAAEDEFFQS